MNAYSTEIKREWDPWRPLAGRFFVIEEIEVEAELPVLGDAGDGLNEPKPEPDSDSHDDWRGLNE
jgi:hypothetical protein